MRWSLLYVRRILAAALLFAGTQTSSDLRAANPRQDAVSIVFGGDVMLSNGPGHSINHGEDPFAEFAPIFAAADLSVCNLECVVAEGGTREYKPYTFWAPLSSLPLLKKYFSAVCLANNHSGDYGKEGFAEQLTNLEKAGVPYFGGGRNRQEARRPLLLQARGRKIALLGYCDFPPRRFEAGAKTPGTAWLIEKECLAEIAAARTRDHADIVIPFLHWGQEMRASPQKWQRDLARRMIDAGADAVLGGHPHVTQTVDLYKGRPIVYSLGNFVFDYYPSDPAVWTGWLVKLTFSRTSGVGMETFAFDIDKGGTPHLLPASKECVPGK